MDAFYHFDHVLFDQYVPFVIAGINHMHITPLGEDRFVERIRENQVTYGFDFINDKTHKISLEWKRFSGDAYFLGFRFQTAIGIK